MPRSSQNRTTPAPPGAARLRRGAAHQALGIALGMAITLLLLTAAAPVPAPRKSGYAWKLIFDDEFRDSSLIIPPTGSYNYPWATAIPTTTTPTASPTKSHCEMENSS